ncbi:MAG: hypothetical protein JKX94_00530, partial [Sneathiella sp.]|nr:hypothetical protein [Sneathiella sp.]
MKTVFPPISALIATLAIMAPQISAAADVRIAATSIDGLHQKDGNGFYDQIFQAVSDTNGTQYEIDYLPPKRALAAFER